MKTLLVSLVSDQTIPNVQLIKEFPYISDYLFVTTIGMEKKGVRKWIVKTCGLENTREISVDEFSFEDITNKLDEQNFELYDKIIVNITGGTKIMTLAAYEFFKQAGVQSIYYITGKDDECLKLFPKSKIKKNVLQNKVTINEYLNAYGFEVKNAEKCSISFDQTERIFNSFCEMDIYKEFQEAYKFLFSKRGKSVKKDEYIIVEELLNGIGYTPVVSNSLNKAEVKYLTGDWFEEYIGNRIKNELNLDDSQLLIGSEIFKEIPLKSKNNISFLLNSDDTQKDSSGNEIDVMFVYQNQFYSIECKTSIIDIRQIPKIDGTISDKEVNILGETIYKSDSLKNRFGLFAKTTIITLTDFKKYIHDEHVGEMNNKIRQMKELIGRANLSNIKLVDKSMLQSEVSLFKLLN